MNVLRIGPGDHLDDCAPSGVAHHRDCVESSRQIVSAVGYDSDAASRASYTWAPSGIPHPRVIVEPSHRLCVPSTATPLAALDSALK